MVWQKSANSMFNNSKYGILFIQYCDDIYWWSLPINIVISLFQIELNVSSLPSNSKHEVIEQWYCQFCSADCTPGISNHQMYVTISVLTNPETLKQHNNNDTHAHHVTKMSKCPDLLHTISFVMLRFYMGVFKLAN